MYAVRRRTHSGFDKLLAMKVLHPQLASERRFVDMFLDEARIAARIEHPNVVTTLDVIEQDGRPLIVMELLRGRSLAALLKKDPGAPRHLLYAILAAAAEGLAAAHDATSADGEPLHVVHRDVSPHNIHVGYDGQVKLIDFGVAAARGRLTSTRTGELKGKLAYLAPEQIMQGTIDRRTDLFALGIVAWESLAGARLFRQDDEAATMWSVVHKPVPPLRSVAPLVPEALDAIVAACLDRSLELRPASALEVARVFEEARDVPAGAREIAAYMTRTFAEERAADEARLVAVPTAPGEGEAAGVADEPARVEADATSASVSGDVIPPAGRADAKRRLSRLAFPLAIVTLAGAATALFTRSRAASPGDAPDSARGAATPAAAFVVEAPAAVNTEVVFFEVDPTLRAVLVDGARRDERPLRLALPPGASALVSLFGPDGRIEEQRITRDDAGRTLALPPPPAAATAAVTTPHPARSVTARAPSTTPAAAPRPAPSATPPLDIAVRPAPSTSTSRPSLLKSPY